MITTLRNRPIGCHVTREVRIALKEEAKRRKTSMSRLMYEILHDWLKEKGLVETG